VVLYLENWFLAALDGVVFTGAEGEEDGNGDRSEGPKSPQEGHFGQGTPLQLDAREST
jgi:hypothetical protein